MNSWHDMLISKHFNVFIFLWVPIRETIFQPFDFFVGTHQWIRDTPCTYASIEMFLFFCQFPFEKPFSNHLIIMCDPINEFMTRHALMQSIKCFYFSVGSHSWNHIPTSWCSCGFQEMNLWHAMHLCKHFNVFEFLWVPICETIFQPIDFLVGTHRWTVTRHAPMQAFKCSYSFVDSDLRNHIQTFWFLCGFLMMNPSHARHLCKHLNAFIIF